MKKKKLFEFLSDFSMSGTRRMDAPGNLRAGQPTFGTHASISSDAPEDMPSGMFSQPQAVVILVRNGDKFLAVSNGPDMSDMNLPGGSVEDGEELRDAAIRELREETGLNASKLAPVYSASGSDGYYVTVFRVLAYAGRLVPSKEGKPAWVTTDQLVSSKHGLFFKRMAKKMKIELSNPGAIQSEQ